MSNARRALAWDHGVLAVQSLGGMLGPVLFFLPDGRQVSPLHVAPWGNDPDRADLPGVLRQLRGDWACIPFGGDAPRDLEPGWDADGESFVGADLPHGVSSHADWQISEDGAGQIVLDCPYPDDHPIAHVRRTITPDPTAPAVDITLEVTARRACRLPIGVHPTFRLPARPGAVAVEPARFRAIHSFPGDLEPGASPFAPDRTFDRLDAVPLKDGGTLDVSALPHAQDFEELLQLAGIAGEVALLYRDEGFRARLSWDAEIFPSALLWMSNRGRTEYPWNGRHIALGIEPVASAFDLGPAISTAVNPLASNGLKTAHCFDPDTPFKTSYRIAVEAA